MSTDYNSWKVVDLKAELKRRDVPQTGLRLKQQLVDRLTELDNDNLNKDNEETSRDQQSADDQQPAAPAAEEEVGDVPEKRPTPPPQPAQDVDEPAENRKEQSPVKEKTPPRANAGNDDDYDKPLPPTTDVAQSPAAQEPAEHTEAVKGDDGAEEPAADEELPPPEQAEKREKEITSEQDDTRSHASDHAAFKPSQDEVKTDVEMKESSITETVTNEAPAQEDNNAPEVPQQAREAQAAQPAEEESRKRRRSESVSSSTETVAKKPKASIELAAAAESEPTQSAPVEPASKSPAPTPAAETIGDGDGQAQHDITVNDDEAKTAMDTDAERKPERKPESEPEPATKSPARSTRSRSADIGPETERSEASDRLKSPSLYPPTQSLYICNLMRPLQPVTLRNHLAEIGTAPEKEPDTAIIQEFFLDPIKTHCFVTFTDQSTAIRVRNALHEVVWPDERMRKQLWVDFIPDHKVREWAKTEQAESTGNGPARGTKRWEVIYNTASGGEVEVGLHSSGGPSSSSFRREIPESRREIASKSGQTEALLPPPSSTSPSQRHARQSGKGFKALDELFKYTKAKPRLYYMPVSRDVAYGRLDRFDDLARSSGGGSGGGGGAGPMGALRRYTFEDQNHWVSVGPDIPPAGGRPYQSGRGRRGRRGGRYYGDSWRAR